MNDLIEERNERTRKRKKMKKKMDSIIGLSYHDEKHEVASLSVTMSHLADTKARLLDEGYIDNGFVIKKGTMQKYLDGKNEKVRGYELSDDGWQRTEVLNLTDDFVGTVNLGHLEFANFPYIIGEWRKDDLTLVPIENDREALDVNINLDEESVFVKELKRQPYDIGVSAEFWYNINEEDTENLSEMLGYYMPVIDEIYIFAFALVGECGNVNSSGLELKGELFDMKDEMMMNLDITTDETEVEVEENKAEESIEAMIETLEDVDETEEEASETTDEVVEEIEEVEEEVEEAEELSVETEVDEEVISEEVMEEVYDEETDDDEVELTAVETYISELEAKISELTAENTALKESNNRLQRKLKNEKSKKEAFVEKFASIVERVAVDETPQQSNDDVARYIHGNGIKE